LPIKPCLGSPDEPTAEPSNPCVYRGAGAHKEPTHKTQNSFTSFPRSAKNSLAAQTLTLEGDPAKHIEVAIEPRRRAESKAPRADIQGGRTVAEETRPSELRAGQRPPAQCESRRAGAFRRVHLPARPALHRTPHSYGRRLMDGVSADQGQGL